MNETKLCSKCKNQDICKYAKDSARLEKEIETLQYNCAGIFNIKLKCKYRKRLFKNKE